MKSYYVYAIRSLKDGRVYMGISADPDKRLLEHNNGDTRSTKGYRPWKLLYKEFVGDRKLARIREKYLKHSSNKQKIIPR